MSEKNITTQYLTKKERRNSAPFGMSIHAFFAKIVNITRGWRGVLIIITIIYSSM